MLSLKGNTAVYLLYAHARIAGIVRKANRDLTELAKTASIKVEHPKEQELALHLCKLPEAVEDMLEELAPNRLTDYLYDLSEKFNSFYSECKVIGSEQEDSRLLLCEATAVVIRQVLYLLGIKPLYRI
jgi:arginyl-tRNA synthetase